MQWEAQTSPAATGGSPILEYILVDSEGYTVGTTPTTSYSYPAPKGTMVQFSVKSRNFYGTSEPSQFSLPIVAGRRPSKLNTVVTTNNYNASTITIAWQADPEDDIERYDLQIRDLTSGQFVSAP